MSNNIINTSNPNHSTTPDRFLSDLDFYSCPMSKLRLAMGLTNNTSHHSDLRREIKVAYQVRCRHSRLAKRNIT